MLNTLVTPAYRRISSRLWSFWRKYKVYSIACVLSHPGFRSWNYFEESSFSFCCEYLGYLDLPFFRIWWAWWLPNAPCPLISTPMCYLSSLLGYELALVTLFQLRVWLEWWAISFGIRVQEDCSFHSGGEFSPPLEEIGCPDASLWGCLGGGELRHITSQERSLGVGLRPLQPHLMPWMQTRKIP